MSKKTKEEEIERLEFWLTETRKIKEEHNNHIEALKRDIVFNEFIIASLEKTLQEMGK